MAGSRQRSRRSPALGRAKPQGRPAACRGKYAADCDRDLLALGLWPPHPAARKSLTIMARRATVSRYRR
jgi:hypothetical protein